MFFNQRIIHLCRKCFLIAQRIININYFEQSGISSTNLLFGNALNLDRGIFLHNDKTILLERQPLSTKLAQLLKRHSDLITKHRRILMEKESKLLAEAPNDSYVLLEPVNGLKVNYTLVALDRFR